MNNIEESNNGKNTWKIQYNDDYKIEKKEIIYYGYYEDALKNYNPFNINNIKITPISNIKNINYYNNYKNIIKLGTGGDDSLINLNYLKKTNLFNLDSYTGIHFNAGEYDFISSGKNFYISISQLIKLPNINIFNNSIKNELKISTGVTGDYSPLFKATIYNYFELFNSLNIILKNNIRIYNGAKSIYYTIAPGLKINLFNRIDGIVLIKEITNYNSNISIPINSIEIALNF